MFSAATLEEAVQGCGPGRSPPTRSAWSRGAEDEHGRRARRPLERIAACSGCRGAPASHPPRRRPADGRRRLPGRRGRLGRPLRQRLVDFSGPWRPVGACLAGSADLIEEASRWNRCSAARCARGDRRRGGPLRPRPPRRAPGRRQRQAAPGRGPRRSTASSWTRDGGRRTSSSSTAPDAAAFAAALAEREVVAKSKFGPTRVRAVTHLDVDDAGINRRTRRSPHRPWGSLPPWPSPSHVPAVRGDLRPGDHDRRRRGDRHPRRRRRRLQPGLPVPEGRVAAGAARGSRPAAHAAAPRARRRPAPRRSWDEAFAEIDRRLPPILAEHGRDAVAVYLGNPTAHNLAALLYGRVLLKALGTKNLFSAPAPSTSTPSSSPSALMFGTGLDRRRARPRPHRPPADARRQPDGLQRQPHDGARRARAPARDPRARREGRRRRPAPHAHRRGGRRAPTSSAPGTDALLLFALVHVLFDEGLVRPGAARGARRRARRGARARGAVHARGRRRGVRRSTADDDPPHRARARRRADAAAVYGRIGTTTQALRHHRELARRRAQRADRQPRPPGRRDVHARRRGRVEHHAASPAAAAASRFGRWRSRVRGLPEVFGELPVAVLAEEIETPGEGQVRALITIAGNPARQHAERRPPGRRARARWTSWSASTSTSTRRRATPT